MAGLKLLSASRSQSPPLQGLYLGMRHWDFFELLSVSFKKKSEI